MSKLKFNVVYWKGEEPDYPAAELNNHSPTTKGWQSPQFCEYPQEIGFALAAYSHITQVQILSHQSKIATKVELFVGEGEKYKDASFRRLGYLSLNNNERSNYQARELKSVYVDTRANFVKLLVHKCFINQYNLFNQVGIIAVNLLGEPLGSQSPGMSGPLSSNQSVGSLPNSSGSYGPRMGRNLAPEQGSDISFDMNYDPETAAKLREIIQLKQQAVKMEDYDAAKAYKLQETQLRALGGQLAQLEEAKRQAVAEEDYDRAKMLKLEIQSLRANVAQGSAFGTPQQSPGFQQQQPSSGGYHPEQTPGHMGPNRMPTPGFHPQQMAAAPMSGGSQPGGISPYEASPVMQASNGAITRDVFREEQSGNFGEGAEGFSSQRPGVMNSPQEPRGGLPSAKSMRKSDYDDEKERPRSRGVAQSKDEDSSDDDDPKSSFDAKPRGPHPLEGVPNYMELPEPETVTSARLDEVAGIQELAGDYRVACLLSKTWSLREAAIVKISMMVPELAKDMNFQSIVPHLCQVAKMGAEDRIAQVFLSTLRLVEACIDTFDRKKMKKVSSELEPIIATLVLKLGDGQARIRDTSLKCLMQIAKSQSVGASVICSHALKKMPKKQASAWRPLVCRLQLLTQLVEEFGVGGPEVSPDEVMDFVAKNNAFAHSSGEVRDAARELTVAIHAEIGDDVERYLGALRPRQLEEYRDAFREAGGGEPMGSPEPKSSNQADSPPREKAVPEPMGKPEESEGEEDFLEESSDPFTCQFCGKYDANFTEDLLDLHYWQECVMLMSCKECSQVIEISCLAEHYLSECEFQEKFVLCDVSGEVVRKEELSSWQSSNLCHPKTDADRCLLCHEDVEAGEAGWRKHLKKDCSKNERLLANAS